jgi:photosystem II stability/assembly factor-like uncharacterized protein
VEKKWAGVHEGGYVTSIAVDPTEPLRVYAATARGLFASSDGAETWRPVAHVAGHFVGALAIEPGRSGVLYLGTNEGEVLRGAAGVKRWTRLDPGLGTTFVSAIAFDPVAAATIYLGTSRGVFRSSDGGAHFEERNRGLANVFVNCLAVEAGGSIVYAGTNSGGVFRSSDGGQVWKAASVGLTSGVVWALLSVPGPPSLLYAATYDGIFRSTDDGSSWVSVSNGLRSRFVVSLAADPRSATIYAGTAAGLFKSEDGGAHWESACEGLTNQFVSVLAIHPYSPATLYAGTNGGVFKTADAARTWKQVRLVPPDAAPDAASDRRGRIAPAPEAQTAARAVSRTDEHPIPAQTVPAGPASAGSPTSGRLSEAVDEAPKLVAAEEGAGLVSALAVDPSFPALLYAATQRGVYRSATAGETWSRAEGPLAELSVFALAVDGSVPGRLYAGTDGAGLFQSDDRGASWTEWNSGLDNLVVSAIAVASPTVYVATNGGVFRSRELGASWEPINSGLTDRAIAALAVSPGQPRELFAATHKGKILHWTEGGSNWSEVAGGPWRRTVRSLVFAGSPPVLWVATERGIFHNSIAGGTWSAANTGLTTLVVSRLQVDPAVAGSLYALTADGVFRCENGGSWTAVSKELASSLYSFTPAPGSLYAGGEGAVWKSEDEGKSWKSFLLHRAEPPSKPEKNSKPKAESAPTGSRHSSS